MTADEKLAAILAAVQTDPGNRGLARDPVDNLFTATAGDFQAACRSIADHPQPVLFVVTGFIIPSADPPTFETDGPLGTVFLARALSRVNIPVCCLSEIPCAGAINVGLRAARVPPEFLLQNIPHDDALTGPWVRPPGVGIGPDTHIIALERAGPAANGRLHTMRGRDITDLMLPAHHLFYPNPNGEMLGVTVGIGDGGNEIGMGKVPHETVVKNIPNGDLVHCRVPTDHLIVAGVSNWGAYALAAGVYVLRGVTPPVDLFDPDREREVLEEMVQKGPLVDGVTGRQTATVDGLTWDEYARPLVRIREILEARP
ncbi:MAG TPA: glutamate cyclase domain-containing protein [Urbifossiella sp.]|nr:glutamate cyclase domain-containing protein [Urbifossiella sp.]